MWSRRSYRVYTSAPTQELTNLYLYSTHYSAILFFYFDNLALNDQKLPTTCMKEMKKKRKFLKHSCYILVAIERGENVFETHSFGVICNKKREFSVNTCEIMFAHKWEEKVFWNTQFWCYLQQKERTKFSINTWDSVCKEMRGESFRNKQFWCYFQ